MKILKLKSILFSLMAIAMVTVFLSSCEEQETLTELNTSETVETNELAKLILPWGYEEEMTLEEQTEYLNSIDKETQDKLKQSSMIFDYFDLLNKGDVLANNAVYGDIFDESILSSYLTGEEVKNFHSFKGLNQNIESRWGCDCDKSYTYYKTKCGWFPSMAGPGHYVKKRYDLYRKQCHAWICPDRLEIRNKRSCN